MSRLHRHTASHYNVLFFLQRHSMSQSLLSVISTLPIHPMIVTSPKQLHEECQSTEFAVSVIDINWFKSGDFSLLDSLFEQSQMFRPLILFVQYKDTPNVLMNRAYMYGVLDFIQWPDEVKLLSKKISALLNLYQDRQELHEDIFHQHFVDDEILDARRELENFM